MYFFPGNKRDMHFTTEDLKSLGHHVCDTLLDFCDPDPTKVKMELKKCDATVISFTWVQSQSSEVKDHLYFPLKIFLKFP